MYLGLAYFALASASLLFTRYGGGMAYLWMATAVLIPGLLRSNPRNWAVPLSGCGIASMSASCIFGAGPLTAPLFTAAALMQAVISAMLLRRYLPDSRYFDSPKSVSIFVVTIGVISPLGPVCLGAAAVSVAFEKSYLDAWISYFTVHALGAAIFVPFFMLLTRADNRRSFLDLRRRRHVESLGLLLIATAVDVVVFAQSTVPILFLAMLPLTVLAFRLGQLGAVIGVVVLVIIGSIFSASGIGPLSLMNGSAGERTIFLEFYFAIAFIMVLPIAAELDRRKQLLRQLQASEAMLRLTVERSSDTILNVAVDGKIRFVSPSVARLGIKESSQIVGLQAHELVIEEDQNAMCDAHRRAIAHPDEIICSEYRLLGQSGTVTWVEVNSRAIIGSSGEVSGVVSAVRDVSDRRAAHVRLETAANTDPLTGLFNRRIFDQRIANAVQCARSGSTAACLAVVDIDHFKQVNDRYGHPAGDMILRCVADVLKKNLRTVDLIARIGGEEFAVILQDMNINEAATFCERVRAAVAAKVTPAGKDVRVTVSIGVVEITPLSNVGGLQIAADEALYRAKAAGRNCLRLAA